MSGADSERYRFSSFEADLKRGELHRHGHRVKIQDKPFQILGMLLQRRGAVVTRAELRDTLWPSGTFVDVDHGLNTAVNKLREALGDTADHPRFIETIPRQGYRFIGSVTAVQQAGRAPAATARRARLARSLAAAGLTASLGVAGVLFYTRAPAGPNRPDQKLMLAVLPLKNLSGDSNEEYFSDGMSEDIITQLGSLTNKRLGVIASTTTARYKTGDKTVGEIGRELSVQYIVEGSVRRASERVRVTAQLVEVTSQNVLWAESYERSVSDVLDMQREIAARIARTLAIDVFPTHPEAPIAPSPAAYEAYLRGRYFRERLTEDDLRKSIESYRKAIELEPRYALAYVGLADAYRMMGVAGWEFTPQGELIPEAKAALERALAIDRTLGEPHAVKAMLELGYDWDLQAAEAEILRAIELNPSLAKAYVWYSSVLTAMGRMEEAVEMARRGYELDPLSTTANITLGVRFYYARRYREAIDQFLRTIELDPNAFVARWGLAQTYWRLGDRPKAIDELKRAVEVSKGSAYMKAWLGYCYGASGERRKANDILDELDALSRTKYVSPFLRALVYAGIDDRQQTLDWLERAYRERSSWMAYLAVEPEFEPLHTEPRFRDLLRRVRARAPANGRT